jgi:hypothetical protein
VLFVCLSYFVVDKLRADIFLWFYLFIYSSSANSGSGMLSSMRSSATR